MAVGRVPQAVPCGLVIDLSPLTVPPLPSKVIVRAVGVHCAYAVRLPFATVLEDSLVPPVLAVNQPRKS